jgi:hypothetical protein
MKEKRQNLCTGMTMPGLMAAGRGGVIEYKAVNKI